MEQDPWIDLMLSRGYSRGPTFSSYEALAIWDSNNKRAHTRKKLKDVYHVFFMDGQSYPPPRMGNEANSDITSVQKKIVQRQTPSLSKSKSSNQDLKLSQQAMLGSRSSPRKLSDDISTPNETSAPEKSIGSDKIPGAGVVKRSTYTPRKVEEPWGSRDDFKKDRASWKKGGS